MRMQLINRRLLIFLGFILYSEHTYAHGDMAIAGLGIMAGIIQLMALSWVLFSKKLKPIKPILFILVLIIFIQAWSALQAAPTSDDNTVLLLYLVNVTPIIMMVFFKKLGVKLSQVENEKPQIKRNNRNE